MWLWVTYWVLQFSLCVYKLENNRSYCIQLVLKIKWEPVSHTHTHTHTRTHMHTHTYINTADPLRTHGGWGCQPSPSQKSKCNSKSVLHIHTFNQVWIRKYSCTYLVEKIHISGPMQFKLLLFKGPLTNTCMHTHTHVHTHTHTFKHTDTVPGT